MAEIIAVSREQSVGADQIAKAIARLDAVIQQNAGEQMASMAEELSGQAEPLALAALYFKLDESAASKGQAAHPAIRSDPREVAA